jgi:hypothetical protein
MSEDASRGHQPLDDPRYVPPPSGGAWQPPGPPVTPPPPAPAPPPPAAAPPASRRRLGGGPIIAIVAGALIGLLVLATAGLAVLTSGTPTVAEKLDANSLLTGGELVISGTATNAGSVDAANVVITGKIETPALQGTLNLGTLAAGASVPFEVPVPIGASTVGAYRFQTQTTWDEPALNLKDDKYDASFQGGHGVVVHTGSVHNSGKAAAPHATLNFTATTDEAGQNKIGSASQMVGDVAAGGEAAYKVSIDLGSSPPQSWWMQYSFDYARPSVRTGQESSQRVGGTLVLSGTIGNDGQAPAKAVTITRTVVDSAGKVLASAQAPIADLAPGKSAPYTVTVDLGNTVIENVSGLGGRVEYTQTRFAFLKSRVNKPLKTIHWAV